MVLFQQIRNHRTKLVTRGQRGKDGGYDEQRTDRIR